MDRIAVLIAENERLKRELGTFDTDFFDQLEDLKFRYASLQVLHTHFRIHIRYDVRIIL